MTDGLDVLEAFAYFGSFWSFVFSAEVRRIQLAEFRRASWFWGRPLMLLEGVFATVIGLGPIVLVGWLIWELAR